MLSHLAVVLSLVGSALVPASAAVARSPVRAEADQPGLSIKKFPRPERSRPSGLSYEPHTVLVKFRTAGAAADLLRSLRRDATVQTASLDYARSLDATPNDPGYLQGYQHNLDAVRLPYAWNVIQNSTSQIIAVLDTGVDTHHEDLASQLVAGYDAVVPGRAMSDIEGHGTMTAGIA